MFSHAILDVEIEKEAELVRPSILSFSITPLLSRWRLRSLYFRVFFKKKKKPAPQARESLPSVALVKSRGIRINQLLLIYTVHHNVGARSDFFL